MAQRTVDPWWYEHDSEGTLRQASQSKRDRESRLLQARTGYDALFVRGVVNHHIVRNYNMLAFVLDAGTFQILQIGF